MCHTLDCAELHSTFYSLPVHFYIPQYLYHSGVHLSSVAVAVENRDVDVDVLQVVDITQLSKRI